jgi:predicted MFS family arabinose efflux permease
MPPTGTQLETKQAGKEKAPQGAPLAFLGLACAIGVSTIYYNQPLLLEMGRTYGVSAGRTGFVATVTQVGYALGLLLFVPLGDVLERRALMMRMYGAVAVALLLVALAPNLSLLIVGSAVIGWMMRGAGGRLGS